MIIIAYKCRAKQWTWVSEQALQFSFINGQALKGYTRTEFVSRSLLAKVEASCKPMIIIGNKLTHSHTTTPFDAPGKQAF